MAFKWFKAEGNGAFIGKDDDGNVFEIHPSRQRGKPHEGYFSEGQLSYFRRHWEQGQLPDKKYLKEKGLYRQRRPW